MGLAATQARFLGLTARKTNVEYEGQQINQQRTALANQSAGLYNQMLSLEVPTPPSPTDYTKTIYTFVDTSTSETITLDSIVKNPVKEGDTISTYTIQGYTKGTGISSRVNKLVTTPGASNSFSINPSTSADGKYTINMGGNAIGWTLNGPITATPYIDTFNNADNRDENAPALDENTKFFKYADPSNGVEYYIPAGNYNSVEELYNAFNNGDFDKNGLTAYSVQSYTTDDYFQIDNAQMTVASDGTGRYEYITYYPADQYDANGELLPNAKMITCKLTQQSIQDDDAFNAAEETYQAKKIIYDKTMAEINAKTEIIQQQDRSLELHLNQLDTEQQAIQTELEVVKKVIDKNIDETFKTFA